MKPALMLLFAAAVGSAQIERPQIGMFLDASGALRPILGVPASAALGDPVITGVLSYACSAQLCLAKTQSAIVASTGQTVAAPDGPAVIALDGSAAYLYFPQSQSPSQTLVRWTQGQLAYLDFTPDGEILSLRANPDGFDYAVRRNGLTWIEHYSASAGMVSALEHISAAGPVLLLASGTLWAESDRVRLTPPAGKDQQYYVSGATGFVVFGDGYVGIVTPNGTWALPITQRFGRLFLLPGVSP